MIDFVGFINSQAAVKDWSAEKKQTMLDDFCREKGWSEMSEMTKKEYMNQCITEYIKRAVHSIRVNDAYDKITIDVLNF